MASPVVRTGEFAFRPLRKPEEFRQAEELQREALPGDAVPVVPAPLLRSLQDIGGLVLGAFADIHLAGITASSIGWDGTTLYHHSHVTAVRPEYQSHRVGFRLKAFQRDEVLRLGLSEVRWGFDPLSRPSASLAVRHLGARPDAYLPNHFGRLSEEERPRDESDLLHVRWSLGSAEVEQRLAGTLPGVEELRERQRSSVAILETELDDSGLRRPTAVSEPNGPLATVEVPFDLATVRDHEPAAVRRWRHAVRDAFRASFDLGYRVDDFAVVSLEHERRGFYLLRPAPPGAGPSPPAPG